MSSQVSLPISTRFIWKAMISPDAGKIIYWDCTKRMYVYDFALQRLTRLELKASVQCWVYHPQLNQIAWIDGKGRVWIRDLNAPRKKRLRRAKSKNKLLVYSHDGNQLALIRSNRLHVLDLIKNKLTNITQPDEYGELYAVVFHPRNTEQLLFGGERGLWHYNHITQRFHTIRQGHCRINNVEFMTDSTKVLFSTEDYYVQRDLNGHHPEHAMSRIEQCESAVFSSGGQYISAYNYTTSPVKLYDLERELVHVIIEPNHQDDQQNAYTQAFNFSADGTSLLWQAYNENRQKLYRYDHHTQISQLVTQYELGCDGLY